MLVSYSLNLFVSYTKHRHEKKEGLLIWKKSFFHPLYGCAVMAHQCPLITKHTLLVTTQCPTVSARMAAKYISRSQTAPCHGQDWILIIVGCVEENSHDHIPHTRANSAFLGNTYCNERYTFKRNLYGL